MAGQTVTAPSVRPRLPTLLMSAKNSSRPAYCTDEPTPVTARQNTSAAKLGAQPVPSSPCSEATSDVNDNVRSRVHIRLSMGSSQLDLTLAWPAPNGHC